MVKNLLQHLPAATTEICEDLAQLGNVRIERIVTPPQPQPGPIYDQDHDEWVLILQGWADLEVESNTHHLTVGDACLLPAHTLHRVLRTAPDQPTIWLALHSVPGTCQK